MFDYPVFIQTQLNKLTVISKPLTIILGFVEKPLLILFRRLMLVAGWAPSTPFIAPTQLPALTEASRVTQPARTN